MVIKLSTRAPKPRTNVHGVDPNPVRTRVSTPRPDRKSDRKGSGRRWNFNLWLEWKRNKFQLFSVWLNRRTETKTVWDQIIYLKYSFQPLNPNHPKFRFPKNAPQAGPSPAETPSFGSGNIFDDWCGLTSEYAKFERTYRKKDMGMKWIEEKSQTDRQTRANSTEMVAACTKISCVYKYHVRGITKNVTK